MTFGFMQSSKNSARLYYVPGLISLIFIPILCLIVINQRKKNLYDHCLEIVVCDKDTTHCFKNKPPERFYQIRYLTGDEKSDTETIHEIDNTSKKYFQNSNTSYALKVVFKDSAKYNSFIKLIDICKKNKVIYEIFNNEFIIFFDFVELHIGDVVFNAKYLDHDLRLIEDEDYEYEIKIKHKPYHGINDVILDDHKQMIRLINQHEKELMRTLILDFINQRRILFGLTCVLYIILFYLAIRKIIK